MDWKTVNRKQPMLKLFCTVLALIFGMSFFIGSGFAKSLCGAECCCPSLAEVGRQADTRLQKMNSHDCCSGASEMPCGIDSGRSLEPPQFILGASTTSFLNAAGSWNRPNFFFSENDYLNSRVFWHNVRAPHSYPSIAIYLQKLSLLI